jgi:hypothetical protein
MNNLKFSILISIIIYVISLDNYEKNTQLGNFYQLNDSNYKDLVFNISSNNSWLLIFYDKKCVYSRGALINLKRSILVHFQHNKTLKFGIIDIEDYNNRKLTTRFNVKRVPHTILVNKDKMYKFNEAFTPGRIIDFINYLNISNYQLVPKDPFEILYKKENENEKPLSFYEQSKLNFIEYMKSFDKPMQEFLDKFSIPIKWTSKKTYLSFIIFLILLALFEYYSILFILDLFGLLNKESNIKVEKSKIKKDNGTKEEKEDKSKIEKKENIKELTKSNKKEKND